MEMNKRMKGKTKKARKSVQRTSGRHQLHALLIASLVWGFFLVCGFNYRKTESHKNFLHLSSYMGKNERQKVVTKKRDEK